MDLFSLYVLFSQFRALMFVGEFVLRLFINYERNSSLGYHHVVWIGKTNIQVKKSINLKDKFYVQTVHTSSWVKDKHWRAIMQAGSARNSFRRFKDHCLYLYQTLFKYMNTNILNLNTDIVQCAKDDELIRNILVASSRFSRFPKTTTSARELWSFVVILPFGFSNYFVCCSLHYYIVVR